MSSDSKHVTANLGVWTVVLNKRSSFVPPWSFDIRNVAEGLCTFLWNTFTGSRPLEGSLKKKKKDGVMSILRLQTLTFVYYIRFVKDVYSLGRWHFFIGILMSIWEMASRTLQLYFSTHVLSSISRCLETRQFEPFSVIQTLVGRVLLSLLSVYLTRIGNENNAIMGERVKYYFLQKTMHKSLNFDLEIAEDPEVRNKVEGSAGHLTHLRSDAWEAFCGLKETTTSLLVILSEISLVLGLSRTSSTFVLPVALSIAHPLLNGLERSLSSRNYVAFCNNSHFSHMAALHKLAFNDRFREDRICNNLGPYIEKEFKRSKRLLGDIRTDDLHYQWWDRDQPIFPSVLQNLSWDFSLIFFALRVIWDHKSVTIGELFLVQEASVAVQSSSYRILYNIHRITSHAQIIRNLYSIEDIQNKVKDGETNYPRSSEKNNGGAEIEFRNVSFRYLGTNKNAVTDISFTIKPGQLVVIVGVNGSGKSSAIKLLARLYDPSAGEILLDGLPLSSYKLADVRSVMAILRQDHPVLPVSLRENVALGLPERSTTEDEITEATHLGGADQFVGKLKQGSETVLNPVATTMTNFVGKTDVKLKAVIDDKETKTDLSGGETQRLSASRTFLRLLGGNIRLLVADEPTSALDPAGEYELFSRLREHRHGKTVIFITHRFGHLTRYADLILCLKDGRLVEQGTHEELLSMDGEYRKLYGIQAKAFVSG